MKSRKLARITAIAFIVFAVYAAVTLTTLSAQINEKQVELDDLNVQYEGITLENMELNDSIEAGPGDDIIARIARDKLGYAMPGERIFEDVSGK